MESQAIRKGHKKIVPAAQRALAVLELLMASRKGMAVSEIAQQFTQGNIETTGNSLDMAVSGNGFFIVSNNGALNYTRDGEFQLNSSGDAELETALQAAADVPVDIDPVQDFPED